MTAEYRLYYCLPDCFVRLLNFAICYWYGCNFFDQLLATVHVTVLSFGMPYGWKGVSFAAF